MYEERVYPRLSLKVLQFCKTQYIDKIDCMHRITCYAASLTASELTANMIAAKAGRSPFMMSPGTSERSDRVGTPGPQRWL